MMVALDIPRLAPQPLGLQVYIESVVKAIIENAPSDWDVTLTSAGTRGKSEHFERLLAVDPAHRATWRFSGVPQTVQAKLLPILNYHGNKNALLKADIVHSFSALPLPTGIQRLIVTVQDLIPLRLGEGGTQFVEMARKNWNALLPDAAKIITISEFSKREIIDILGIEPTKICVIPNGVNAHHFKPLSADQFSIADNRLENLGVKGPYLLHIGGSATRKNAARIVDVFNKLKEKGVPHRLIFAGANRILDELATRINASKYKDLITTLPFLAQDDALLLLQRADVLIFPSVYEGFGLPPLEAMSCGVPVSLSTAASLPEVGGDAVSYFDPLDEEDMTNAVLRLIEDRQFRTQCITRGLCRSKLFSWDLNARATLNLYDEILMHG